MGTCLKYFGSHPVRAMKSLYCFEGFLGPYWPKTYKKSGVFNDSLCFGRVFYPNRVAYLLY